MAGAEVDELFDVKNSLYIGNYQHCINESQKVKLRDDASRIERDVFLYRALLGQRKYGVVQSQIKPGAAPPLQAIKLLAQFLQDQQQTSVVGELEALVASSSLDPSSVVVAIAAATVYCHLDNYEAALKVLNQHDTLECRAHMVHIYLAIHRPDAAAKELRTMQEKDDDATLTQLALAWLNVAKGGEKLQDAYYIYQELIDKNSSTPLLLAGQAACFLGQGKTEEAEAALQEALDKDSNCAETLVNLMVLALHTAKPGDVSSRYLAQLRDSCKNHEVVKSLDAKEEEFDRVVRKYAPSQA